MDSYGQQENEEIDEELAEHVESLDAETFETMEEQPYDLMLSFREIQ